MVTVVPHVLRPGVAGHTPLVLLHAFPVDSRMWSAVGRLITAGTPVIAIDLPGMGAAPAPDAAPALEAAADAVAALLSGAAPTESADPDRPTDSAPTADPARPEVPAGPAVVAGLSMGGYVALALAERHPELVAALALLDTKAVADTPEAAANRRRIADEAERTGSVDPVRPMVDAVLGDTTRATRPDLVRQLAGWIDEQHPAGIAWSQRAMAARPDRSHVLRGWTRPALVLVGAEDGPTPPEQAAAMAGLLGIEPVVIPAAGHLTAIEQPTAVAQALTTLLIRADR
ncbi:alpha/beta fold hydrolase [Cellulomonas taurus]|uniref:alpha/beta fold hydrolase n=1 Tax=Cellulomonas taurus TaxID=2729175 RepID=UPI00145D1E01|nr:alpha/beta hydrolase [Cellulomonas taurus]